MSDITIMESLAAEKANNTIQSNPYRRVIMTKTIASKIFTTVATLAGFAVALAIAMTPAVLMAYQSVA